MSTLAVVAAACFWQLTMLIFASFLHTYTYIEWNGILTKAKSVQCYRCRHHNSNSSKNMFSFYNRKHTHSLITGKEITTTTTTKWTLAQMQYVSTYAAGHSINQADFPNGNKPNKRRDKQKPKNESTAHKLYKAKDTFVLQLYTCFKRWIHFLISCRLAPLFRSRSCHS